MQNPGTFIDIECKYSDEFLRILQQLHCSLLVSTYQAGKVIVIGSVDNSLEMSFLDFQEPMGIAVHKEGIAIGTERQIQFLRPAHDVLKTSFSDGRFDGAFIGHSSVTTGNIHCHELGWGSDGLWIVNTLFSTLCTLREGYSFVPRWKPPFIKQLGEHDCCHLNGLAMRDGNPAYVTMLSPSSEPSGWRQHKQSGGCIMEVETGHLISTGFSMPHSPRWYDNRLWVLNSGLGEFGTVATSTGQFEPIALMPGFLRGLCFVDRYAFVGLSRARESNMFSGIPILEFDNLRCGIGIVDLQLGKVVGTFEFEAGVEEIFAVEPLLGITNPLFSGSMQKGAVRELWLIPETEHSKRSDDPLERA